jgi:hypothetical protein
MAYLLNPGGNINVLWETPQPVNNPLSVFNARPAGASNDLTITTLSPVSPLSPFSAIATTTYRKTGNVSTITTDYAPVITYPITPGLNLNLDPKVHDQLTNYYYYKTLDKWLLSDMSDILKYLTYSNGSVKPGKSSSSDTDQSVRAKIKYIEDNVFSKSGMYKLLNEYVLTYGVNWYDLERNSFQLKELIRAYLKKKLKRA